jgi:kinetochor protein Mis14/NSL1
VTSLYAQLESLTTTVAQLRRDAPGKAAKAYADALAEALDECDADAELLDQQQRMANPRFVNQDVEMTDGTIPKTEDDADGTTPDASSSAHIKKEWKLKIPFGTNSERERWHNGEMAEIYSDTLRTLLRLQGEYVEGDEEASMDAARKALSTTMGTAERAGRAAEVVEKM